MDVYARFLLQNGNQNRPGNHKTKNFTNVIPHLEIERQTNGERERESLNKRKLKTVFQTKKQLYAIELCLQKYDRNQNNHKTFNFFFFFLF